MGEKRMPGAQDYANTIRTHAARTKGQSLYPGPNYRALADFIEDLRWKQPHSLPHPSRSRHFDFAAIHDLAFDVSESSRLTLFDSLSDFERFDTHEDPRPDSGQILFLRGYPSPDWIRHVGAKYRIDPEFFRRQLILDRTLDFFDLPMPPSSSENIIALNITSIGRCNSTTLGRQTSPRALQKYSQNLGTKVGESIVRRFSWHDEEHFSIEQQISLCVVNKGAGWVAIVLLDNGRNLDEGPIGPWFSTAGHANQLDDVFLPVIQSPSRIALRDADYEAVNIPPCASKDHATFTADSRRSQSASLLPIRPYGSYQNPAILRCSPFYALHPLFAFCAFSESQFLNLVQSKIDTDLQSMADEYSMESILRNLKYHKQILQDHILQLDCNIIAVKRHGSPTWPRAHPENGLEDEMNENTAILLSDYEQLHRRAGLLSKRCAEGMEDIRNAAMLLESRKAIKQAEAVTRITVLAFFFIPLSFTTSFFGMNFTEFGTGKYSIWIWFVVSIPIFLVALVLCFWDEIIRFSRSRKQTKR